MDQEERERLEEVDADKCPKCLGGGWLYKVGGKDGQSERCECNSATNSDLSQVDCSLSLIEKAEWLIADVVALQPAFMFHMPASVDRLREEIAKAKENAQGEARR